MTQVALAFILSFQKSMPIPGAKPRGGVEQKSFLLIIAISEELMLKLREEFHTITFIFAAKRTFKEPMLNDQFQEKQWIY